MKDPFALVLLPASGPAADSDLLERSVGGVPVFLRTLLSLQRVGCTRVIIGGNGNGRVVDHLKSLARDSRLRCTVEWAEGPDGPTWPAGGDPSRGGPFYRVPANTVFDFQLLRELEIPGDGEILRVGGPECGIEACGPALSDPLLQDALNEPAWQERMRECEQAGKVREIPANRYWHRVQNPADLREAERKVFQSLRDNEGGLEGFLDRHLTRQFSMPLTWLLARTPLTPNQVTFLSFVVGVVSLYFFSLAGYANKLLASLLFLISTVIDCCDGEIARLKFQQSRLGGILDMAFDTVIHTFLMLCIGIGLKQDLGQPVYVWLGAACAVGSFLACAFTLINQIFETRTLSMVSSPQESVVQSKTRFSRMVEAFSNRDFSWYLFLVAALGLLHWLIWVFTFGVQVFWIMLAVLYFKEHRVSRPRES